MTTPIMSFKSESLRGSLPLQKKVASFGRFLLQEISPTITMLSNANSLAHAYSENPMTSMISEANMGYLSATRVTTYLSTVEKYNKALKAGDQTLIEESLIDKRISFIGATRTVIWVANLFFTGIGVAALAVVATVALPVFGLGGSIAGFYTAYRNEKKISNFITELEGPKLPQEKMGLLISEDDPVKTKKDKELEAHLNTKQYSASEKARILKRLISSDQKSFVKNNFLNKTLTPRGNFLVRENDQFIREMIKSPLADRKNIDLAQSFIDQIVIEAKGQKYIQTGKALTISLCFLVAFVLSVVLLFFPPLAVLGMFPSLGFLVGSGISIPYIAYNQYNEFIWGKTTPEENLDNLSTQTQNNIALTNLGH